MEGLVDEQQTILIYAKSDLEKMTFLVVCISNIQKSSIKEPKRFP